MPYSVPQNIDQNKIFLVNFSEFEGRWDPIYYASNFLHRFTQRHSAKLKDVCVSFSSGFGAGKNEQTDEKNGYIQIRPTNISNNGELVFDKTVFVPLQKAVGFVEKRTVLFNNTNSQELVGKTAILLEERELYTSNHITSIIVDETKANAEYIWIILNVYQRNKIFYSLCTNWNNQSGIGLDLLQSLKIPVPPLHIQQQIVNVYNAALSQRKKKLSESKAKLASIDQYLLGELGITLPEDFHEKTFIVNYKDVDGGRLDPFYHQSKYINIEKQIFKGTYSPTKLKKLCYAISGVVYSSSDERKEGKAILRANNITLETNELNFDSIRYIDSSIKLSDDLKLHKNDILMCTASGSKEHAGKVAFISEELNYYFGGFMSVIRICNSDINATYLFEYMASRFFKLNLFRNLGGTNINNVNFKMIENFEIPLPPLSKQREIVDHISAIRAEAKALEQEANAILEQAKKKVESMIFAEDLTA